MLQIKLRLFAVFALSTLTLAYAQEFKNKLNILILYESLCPDSKSFMATQLASSYDSIKDYVDITLVPFGKSKSNNAGAEFFCQHGPAECEGNRLQSCVLQQTSNQTLRVSFAICQMTAPNPSDVKYCTESNGLSSDIDHCMKTELGTYLQLQAENLTQAYAPTFVPTIIYDGVFDQRLQDESMRDFRSVVCGLLQKRGVACQQSRVHVTAA